MDSKEDEEISIDFSKIKNFFKGDKKEEKKAEESPSVSTEQKKDDDISLDFSKIKSFFKSSTKEEKKEEHRIKEEKDGDEISFDFGRIKTFFKSREKEASASDEDVPVNWSKIFDFFKKYGVVFLALIPIILSIYIRMQAGFLPITDEWATNTVMNGITSQIRASIDQQYPNLPDANKGTLVDTELQKVIAQNKGQIGEQIKATSNYFKTFFQEENGKNYMPDIDPYYWLRYAKNIVDHGHPGDTLKDGRPFDTYQLAPVGRFVTADFFHIYFLAYFYKFLHFFVPDLTLMRSLFYYPVFVSALSVLLIFLIARKIAGNTAGFFAGLMMAINAAFLGRTLFGHADSDAWVVFFPLIVTWLFVSITDVKNITIVIVITAIAGFFTGLYTFAWSGWWYIFDFLLATIAITFLYLVLINLDEIRKNIKLFYSNTAIKNIIIIGIVYFLSTAVFTILFSGWLEFRNSFLGPFSFPSIKSPTTPSLWPNVLTTVAELNEGSINAIINSMGGQFLFFISLLGLILSTSRSEGLRKFDAFYIIGTAAFYGIYFMLRRAGYFPDSVYVLMAWVMLPIPLRIIISAYKKDSSYDFKLPILLSLWVISTIFASIRGIRFTLLLAPAFSVAFGVAVGMAYVYLSKLLTKEFKIHKAVGSGILIVLLLLMYINPTRGAINASGSDIPIINDAWYNTLTAIKQNSDENAIITSWWDFGHHFKALAERRVTFDGTTQTDSAAHWVGRFFSTDNELEAMGILRMLDCKHNTAYTKLLEINNDSHKALKIVKEIILLDEEKARQRLLEYGLNQQQAEEILSYTHCNPPEGIVIASEDMIGKSGVWAHFGSWNFEKADIWQNARKMPQEKAVDYMMKKFNYTKERAENIYFEIQSITSDSEANAWVAPWPGYAGEVNCRKEEEIYVCSPLSVGKDNSGRDVTVRFNVDTKALDIFGKIGDTTLRPSAAAFTTDEGLVKKSYKDDTVGYGMAVIPRGENEVQVILSSKELTGSMFTRMFYMQGHGLRYFKLSNHQRGLTGTNTYTYKADWEGKNITIIDDFVKKPVEEEIKENVSEIINLESNISLNDSNKTIPSNSS